EHLLAALLVFEAPAARLLELRALAFQFLLAGAEFGERLLRLRDLQGEFLSRRRTMTAGADADGGDGWRRRRPPLQVVVRIHKVGRVEVTAHVSDARRGGREVKPGESA